VAGKSTAEEMEERVDYTARMLARRVVKSDIKRELKSRYGVTARTCEEYLSRARGVVLSWTGKAKAEHRVDSLAFYESVLQGDASVAEKIKAQERIDKLLGLEEPQRLKLSLDDILDQLPPDLSAETRRAIIEGGPGGGGEAAG
jgi:hypothetical protein